MTRPRAGQTVFDPRMSREVNRVLRQPLFRALGLTRAQEKTVRRALLEHGRLWDCPSPGQVIVRQGEYGNSAFFVLAGRVRVVLTTSGERPPRPPATSIGTRLRRWRDALAGRWRSGRPPEWRDRALYAEAGRRQAHEPGVPQPTFLQGYPCVLEPYRKALIGPGEIFGELAALSRAPRQATVVSEEPALLLELRWQGLRRVLRAVPALQQQIERLYRERSLLVQFRHTEILQQVHRHPRIASLLAHDGPGGLFCGFLGWQVSAGVGHTLRLPGRVTLKARLLATSRGRQLFSLGADDRAADPSVLTALYDRLQATPELEAAARALAEGGGFAELPRRLRALAMFLETGGWPLGESALTLRFRLRRTAGFLRRAALHQWSAGCVAQGEASARAAEQLELAASELGAGPGAADALIQAASELREVRRLDPQLVLVQPCGDGQWRWHWRLRLRAEEPDAGSLEAPTIERLGQELLRWLIWSELAESATLERHGDPEWAGEFIRRAQRGEPVEDEARIAEQGEPLDALLLVRTGFVRVSRQTDEGRRTVRYLSRGQHHGLEPLTEGWRADPVVDRGRLRHRLSAVGCVDLVRIPAVMVAWYVLPALEAAGRLEPSEPAARVAPQVLAALGRRRAMNGTAGMVIDLDRCTRCDDCVRACAETHLGNPRFVRQGPVLDGRYQLANACMHCCDPVCMIGCPTGAIHQPREGEGRVLINDTTCIGCGVCADNCPYQAIQMVEIRAWPRARLGAYDEFLVDDARGLPLEKATKCDLCLSVPGGPACERACPQGALARVDLRDEEALARVFGEGRR